MKNLESLRVGIGADPTEETQWCVGPTDFGRRKASSVSEAGFLLRGLGRNPLPLGGFRLGVRRGLGGWAWPCRGRTAASGCEQGEPECNDPNKQQ